MLSGSSPERRSFFSDCRNLARRYAFQCFDHRLDMRGRGATAAAGNVKETRLRKFLQERRGVLRRLVVFAERVRQPGVRVQAGFYVGDFRQLFNVRAQILGAERAIQPDREGAGMRDRIPERFGGLAGKRAAAGIGNRAGHHDRHVQAMAPEIVVDGEQRRFAVQRVEYGFDHEQIDAAVHQTAHAFCVAGHQLVERDVAEARVIDVRRNRRGAAGGAEHAGDETRLTRSAGGKLVRRGACKAGAGAVELVD